MVAISAAVSLLFFHGLVGVREGTIISALLVGFVMRQMQKACLPGLLRFVERENKIARALQQLAKGYQLDASGKPKIIIAIGREFGSGGYEIGKLLAEKMGIPFYDRKIDEMAAERSGLPMSKVEELERHMERELVYDFKNAVYDMHHDVMSPEERLFVAQTDAIREIAAGDESCVIMGRCADFVLYNNPNCFRIFIHAIPSARIQRTMNKYQISFDEAKVQMEQTDAARASHYKRFTGRQYGKQEYYHLGIDSGILGIEATTTMIIGTLREWCAVRGTAPLSILEKKQQKGGK